MKFIHTADLHLDSKIDGLPTDKSKIRREEIVRSFEKMVDYADKNDVVAIIIAGDMFDTSGITIKTRARVLECIKSHPHIDFLYLQGNHDEVSFANESDMPTNLITFNDEYKSISYGDVVITGIVLTSLNQKVVYDSLMLGADKTNILAMHGQIVGYKSQEKAEVISLPKLKQKNIDYLALGHIHSYVKGQLDDRGSYAYSGCLDGRGFDELGEKGFVLLNCAGGKVESEFVPFSSRILYEFEYDVQAFETFYKLTEYIVRDLNSKISDSSLVKIILKGQHKTDYFVDKFSLAKRLNETFFYAKVYDKTTLEINLNDYEFDKSVRGEFVRAVWESDLTQEEKNKIIMCGLSALKGEEI